MEIAGVTKTDWSWAALLVDLDNDGFKDIAVTNGNRRNTQSPDSMINIANFRQNLGQN